MKYRFTMPTQAQCDALCIKREGLYGRTQMWLLGAATALSWVTKINLMLSFPGNSFIMETSSEIVVDGITERLESYGFIREEMK